MANTTADKLALAAANKVAIKAAIEAKNPATAPTDVMSQWPNAIASIPSGTKYGGKFDFQKPVEWPEIRDLLDDDPADFGIPETYVNKIAMLISDISTPFSISIGKAYRTSDGTVYNQNSISHQFSQPYSWIVCYSDGDFGSMSIGIFRKVKWIEGNATARSTMVDMYDYSSLVAFNVACYVDLFVPTYPLIYFRGGPNDLITWSNRSRLWNGLPLSICPTADNTLSEYASKTGISGLLYRNSFLYLPNLIDLRAATSITQFMDSNDNLRAYPRRLFANVSFDISYNAKAISERDSFCRFVDGDAPDTSGNPSDEYGLCNNINANPTGEAPTMTISSYTKAMFTPDEQAKVEAMLRNKGWGIAW